MVSSYKNALYCAKVRTYFGYFTLKVSVSFCFSLCSADWFEVGGAQLENGDVTVCAPIRIQQHLKNNLII